MSILQTLFRLQTLDSSTDAIRLRLYEIDRALAGSPAINHARAELQKTEAALRSLSTDLKTLELDSQAVDQKIKEEEERLYSGKIRSPKEILEVQREVELLKQRRARMDEQMILHMEQLEQLQAERARCALALAEAERIFAEDSRQLRETRAQLLKEAKALLEQREALCAGLSPSVLQTYMALRKRKSNGVAVARVKAGACSQCGESLSSLAIQQARHGADLVFCGNCGRILYAE